MEKKNEIAVIPTLTELIEQTDETKNQDALIVILNQPPPDKWLCPHPTASIKDVNGQKIPLPYLPINKVEYLLTKIYRRWWSEVKSVQSIANSVCVTVRLHVMNPLTGLEEWQDGVGAAPIQTDSGKGAMDWNYAKSHGVQIAAPAAETYAIKDAAEKFGKIFGKDLGRRDSMDYNIFIPKEGISLEDLTELYLMKKSASMDSQVIIDAERILGLDTKQTPEPKSFKKLHAKLMAL